MVGRVKYWKIVEAQLRQAREFLHSPEEVVIPDRGLDAYEEYVDNGEFASAMEALATSARQSGCKSGFWRRLKKVATQLGLHESADQYERCFHEALATSRRGAV